MEEAPAGGGEIPDVSVPDLVWEAVRLRAAEDGVSVDEAVVTLLRAYGYGRITVTRENEGRLHLQATVTVPYA